MASDEAAIEKNTISWECVEKTIHNHDGWVQMPPALSEELKNAYASYPSGVIRIKGPNDVVWKFDLGSMTQRRLLDGTDQCTRRIRRIHTEDNHESGNSSSTDLNAPPSHVQQWKAAF